MRGRGGLARSLSILTCNACRCKSCEKKLEKLTVRSSLLPRARRGRAPFGQRTPQKTARRRAARTPQWKEARRWHARSVRVYHRRVRCRAPARLPERTAARREQSKGSLRQSQRGSQRQRRHHHRRVQGVGCDVATSRTSDDPWGVGGDPCARRGRTDVRRRSRKACRTHKKVEVVSTVQYGRGRNWRTRS